MFCNDERAQMKRSFQYTINLDDIDFMGVVGHSNWLLILQRARVQLLEAAGWSYDKMKEEGIAATVRSVSAEYLSPVLHREIIAVDIEAVDVGKTSILLRHVGRNAIGKDVLKCDLRIVFVNQQGFPVRIPNPVLDAIMSESST